MGDTTLAVLIERVEHLSREHEETRGRLEKVEDSLCRFEMSAARIEGAVKLLSWVCGAVGFVLATFLTIKELKS